MNWAAAAAEHAVTMLRSRVGRVLVVVGRPALIEEVRVAGAASGRLAQERGPLGPLPIQM